MSGPSKTAKRAEWATAGQGKPVLSFLHEDLSYGISEWFSPSLHLQPLQSALNLISMVSGGTSYCLWYLPKTNCSGKKIQLTLTMEDYNLIFIRDGPIQEGKGTKGAKFFPVLWRQHFFYTTSRYIALLVPLATPLLGSKFLSSFTSFSQHKILSWNSMEWRDNFQ